MAAHVNTFPKLHNAMWPGVVGKGEGGEPPIGLETMLDLTAAAEVVGVKFDGVDLFLCDPHVSIDSTDADLERLAERVRSRNLKIGSLVAPVWGGTGGGSAMGDVEEQGRFLTQVTKACKIGKKLREMGIRPYGLIRIDSAVDPASWAADPEGNQKKIAATFSKACDIADLYEERLAAEGEICWGGMHSWKRMVQLLELVNRPQTLGFQADMAHTLLYLLGYNAPEDALLPEGFAWDNEEVFLAAYEKLTSVLRSWTNDLHIAQNDATVKGAGSHDKTGRHCLPDDPNGKLDIPRLAGYWLRSNGQVTRRMRHICWDGCMFSNETLMKPQTWNAILSAMLAVRDAHGWQE
ncbi:MAG TPA: TIM barrel protein [Candidatus Sumerlaeota bacterium]|nr:TIM barrel protein [Candidatus Sumerlaeota bacterium]